MRDLYIASTESTPEISCKQDGYITITGISMPEDAARFFFEIFDWVSDYYRHAQPHTYVEINLTYLNTISASMLRKLLYALHRLQLNGKSEVTCNWYYDEEDEDTASLIADYNSMIDSFTINMVRIAAA